MRLGTTVLFKGEQGESSEVGAHVKLIFRDRQPDTLKDELILGLQMAPHISSSQSLPVTLALDSSTPTYREASKQVFSFAKVDELGFNRSRATSTGVSRAFEQNNNFRQQQPLQPSQASYKIAGLSGSRADLNATMLSSSGLGGFWRRSCAGGSGSSNSSRGCLTLILIGGGLEAARGGRFGDFLHLFLVRTCALNKAANKDHGTGAYLS
ncbi:unnamed protein product [Protopolystoma xenopodis]|uniref:Uncharacterized protein n=1 Tax=Protopolystoma xenopodis TaxID=117903 RepID=A0A3S5AH90_9PLAT|nr:unnamed protein product [Protopolystoma xenopodis]